MEKINTDSLPKADLLDRKVFADQIANSLASSFINGEDSFVLGINGKWGSGKTTLMHYLRTSLKQALRGNSSAVFFEFNPWMFSGKDELLSSFFDQFAKHLSVQKIKNKINALASALAYFDWVKYLNSTAGNIQEAAKDGLKKIGSGVSILDLKKEIDAAIIEKDLRIFVFIDDLDRLTPREVVELFQIVKLNASFKNTVFIVAYDKEVVQDILELHHGFKGEKYLEKIIQVDYRIPDLLDEVLQKIFFEVLRDFLHGLNISYHEMEFHVIWTVARLRYYFFTLRDIYRYFNALKLRLPAIKQDVDLYQFCIIEAIRIFDYEAYEAIQKNYKKGLMYGPQTNSSRFASQIKNETTQVLYDYLFSNRSELTNAHPISDPQYFDRYFALQLGSRDIKEEIVDRFIKDKTARTYLMESLTMNGGIKNLLHRLRDKNIDLAAVNPIIRWKAETEEQFIECIPEYVEAIAHIVKTNGNDAAVGINYLASIIPGDEGFFNPARFYLLYYLNDVVFRDENNFFYQHLNAIRNHSATLIKAEKDFLKRWENDHLIFQWPYTRTHFFHKLFLMRYRQMFPDEYTTKVITYFEKQENVFRFLTFIIDVKKPLGDRVDSFWTHRLLNASLFNILVSKREQILKDGLTLFDRKVLDAFDDETKLIRQTLATQDESSRVVRRKPKSTNKGKANIKK